MWWANVSYVNNGTLHQARLSGGLLCAYLQCHIKGKAHFIPLYTVAETVGTGELG